jgi:2-polyprenyl-3-methyl-5-hydroxy-6-metoxy-1,4-benzoquinol methylase
MVRLRGLYDLYQNIKENGIRTPICIERTGERFDGSYRMMIANHLKLPSVRAQLFRFDWRDMNEEYLKRKLHAHEMAFGADYYQFEYKPGMWNIEKGGQNYIDNAKERSDFFDMFLQDLPGRTVLDLGCNEGYMGIHCALKGAKVIGYEYDKAREANAWLNKLIFEWVHQKDIDVEFRCEDFTDTILPKTDVTLMLNVLYHIKDREVQKKLLRNLSGTLILQCNLRKIAEREFYYTSHPDDAVALLKETGWEVVDLIDFNDKPIIIARKK